MTLQCGFGARDVTPPPGLPMGGYAARTEVAVGALDPLWCRVAVLSDGVAALALVVLDWVWVAEEWAGRVRQRVAERLGTSPSQVLVAATHTHAGPAVFHPALEGAAPVRTYELGAAERVLDAVDDARAALRPATLGLAVAAVEGVGASRVEAGAESRCSVGVLAARAPSGRCLGAVAVFGCHPTVLPPQNLRYSADLFGAAVRAAEAHLAAPVVLCNGAGADVSTRFTRREQTASEVARLGARLGAAVAQAAAGAVPLVATPLRGRVEQVAVRPRAVPAAEACQQQVGDAVADLERARRGGAGAGEERRAAARLEGALVQLYLAAHGGVEGLLGRVPEAVALQCLGAGECDILAVPGELASSFASRVCARRRRPALVVGYANDYIGYLVPPPGADGGGYESSMAVIEPSSVAALVEHLERMTPD